MTTFQNAPKKVLLTASLFSLFLVTTATHKAMAETTTLQQPLTTVATVPNQTHPMNMDIELEYECDESEKHVQQKMGEQEVALFGPYRWYRRFKRIFG